MVVEVYAATCHRVETYELILSIHSLYMCLYVYAHADISTIVFCVFTKRRMFTGKHPWSMVLRKEQALLPTARLDHMFVACSQGTQLLHQEKLPCSKIHWWRRSLGSTGHGEQSFR